MATGLMGNKQGGDKSGVFISREKEIYPSLQNYMKASLPLPHPILSWPKPNFKVVPSASNIKQGAVRTPVPRWSGLFHLLPLSSHQLMYSPYTSDCRGSTMFLLDFFRKCIRDAYHPIFETGILGSLRPSECAGNRCRADAWWHGRFGAFAA